MNDNTPTHLRLYEPVEKELTNHAVGKGEPQIAALCSAFRQATGRPLCFEEGRASDDETILEWSAPVKTGDGTAPGHLRIDRSFESPEGTLDGAVLLARQLVELVNALADCQAALRQREIELATSLPAPARREDAKSLADRIHAVVQGAAESLGCQAAAMYLLDESTTELKLRAQWGLSDQSLIEPPRPLESATADLEAMLGNCIVLDNPALYQFWKVPEPDYDAAVCVPIASPTTVLGTFWLFSSEPKDFSERECNLIEMLAGRLAAELERDALLSRFRNQSASS